MNFGIMEILQDDDVSIDVTPYFYNVENIVVTGLPGNLAWSPPLIIGSITNDDMFDSADITEITPASPSIIRFHIGNESNPVETSFSIKPVNVNDPPELKSPLTTQYFDINQA